MHRVSPWDTDDVLREELFSMERLEQHAASLAVAQRVDAHPVARPPLRLRLKDNATVLLADFRAIATAVRDGRGVTPAAEWLLDNYHIVEAQICEINEALPPGYYRQLPKLADGPLRGYPRVFGLAWSFVAHTDSHFDPEALRRFVSAYQRVQPLTIGELWAVAISLRIVLVENLRRVAARIASGHRERQNANAVADRLLGVDRPAERDALNEVAAANKLIAPAFVVQLTLRLRDQDPDVTPALRLLEQHLIAHGTTSELMVQSEHQRQAGSNLTVRNVITSMRLISDTEWSEFFESVSLIDVVLRTQGSYAAMDFATRNLYRTAIEDLSRGCPLDEMQTTQAAVEAARRGAATSERAGDSGYYLIGTGRVQFEAQIGYRPPLASRPRRLIMRLGAGAYIGAITGVALLIIALALRAVLTGIDGAWRIPVFGVLGLIPAIDAAVAFVNRAVTRGIGATVMPGLALRDGIPPPLRTLIAIPTLLTTSANIDSLVEQLEVHYLASSQAELYFALLTDWGDAASEHTPADDVLLESAVRGIGALNARHGATADGDRFILLHRRRVWCEVQRCWMGWERKRGKLHELNRLLRGATDTTFRRTTADGIRVPPAVRFVLTLDGDTRLPRESARRLVGKLAHPLNRPRFDTASGRIVEGYGVLQPRVSPSLPTGSEGSLFQRIVSSASGLDPYAAAVSDVYQDLFGEGSFTGKGIYDVDAFEAALHGRAADGTLLSHDLFEGIFARAGLASDVEVIEEFPARYDLAAARQHRWARGDWQLLPWLFGRRHAAGGARSTDWLPLIGRWKIADNLRRTLSAPASFVALTLGWTLPPQAALLWTGFVVATNALPTMLPVIAEVVPRRPGITPRSHLRALGGDFWLALRQIALQVTLLPHQAVLMSDAILRTGFRVFISHRRLLEWVTAAQAGLRARLSIAAAYRRMAGALLLTIAAALYVGAAGNASWWLVAPFFAVWLASPAIAVWISRSPRIPERLKVSAEDGMHLRRTARRTWRYFETFVTADDHMLPPDNFQEDPQLTLAHRTSPTNLGLYLLATACARDFGWVDTSEACERLEATLATMESLQRCHGHFLNWYDTRTLAPLEPHYVSSVDSGNLAGHLITVANALRDWQAGPAEEARSREALADALSLAREAAAALRAGGETTAESDAELDRIEEAVRHLEGGAPVDASALQNALLHAQALCTMAALSNRPNLSADCADLQYWLGAAARASDAALRERAGCAVAQTDVRSRLTALASRLVSIANAMDFRFLYDPERRLLSIGYLIAEGKLDPSCYDLLASEARLASFYAIAKNDVPTRHWFRLGRPVTAIGHGAALLSWSGSMFEYLMPSLIMRAPRGSLLDETNVLIVRRQMGHAAGLGVPWGISESAYNARDLEFTYQYSNFGVPSLGLKRGLSANLVVAPYATALAAMVRPADASCNLKQLALLGALGRYGFYEALDFTPLRVPTGTRFVVVRSFMAHHQGMTIVAIANVLMDGIMRRRFHAEPRIQATELLLQERTPRDVSIAHPRAEEIRSAAAIADAGAPAGRRLSALQGTTPQVNLLSNGRYAVMLTAAGSGYSRWRDIAVNRWREDGTRDDTGSYIFLRDADSSHVWSAGFQPTAVQPEAYEANFSEDRAEFVRQDATITTTLSVLVSPEDDAEVRHLAITNAGNRTRRIEVTSYIELALAPPGVDAAHPAFSKLFVQTEYVARLGALLATRRRRQTDEAGVWAAHHSVVEGGAAMEPEYETDRARFIGRSRELCVSPAALDGRALSNTVGTVLDPVFALRHRLIVGPGETARVAFWTSAASTREQLLMIVDKHRDPNAVVRAAMLAWTQAQIQLRHLGISAAEAGLFQRLAGYLLFSDAALRASSDAMRRGIAGPAALWSQGISADLPILLLRIDDTDQIDVAHQVLQAHEYWRMKQLAVDVVLLNERESSYVQDLQTALETIVRMSQSRRRGAADAPRGSVFVLRTDLISAESRAALGAVARVVLSARRGTLTEQLERLRIVAAPVAPSRIRSALLVDQKVSGPAPHDLEFFNGLGGFSAGGREYVTLLGPGQVTPAPWINVVANAEFGFHVAADGGGYTWSVNSREHALTPWSNDPVSDRPGELLFVKDEESGALWGATAAPFHDPRAHHTARHGQGYSCFEHESHGIALELLQFVPLQDPIKISRLRIRNTTTRRRRLSAVAYVEWVLGPSRTASAPFVVTELDAATGALLAFNPWNQVFGSRVAFADLCGQQTSWTCDRREFLGRYGTLDRPAALRREAAWSKRAGAGLDPCAALAAPLELEPGAEVEVIFLLGDSPDVETARALIRRYRGVDLESALRDVIRYWDDTLGAVQVRTPDRALDIMLNRWMLYQTIACRMWARSAFYQASGAYGFRDQLQDTMALCIAAPALARAHLVRAAGRQFVEGDVQHWWLPVTGQGVRTRISDDRVWLAHTAAHYVDATGDTGVLDEVLPFIDGQALHPDEADAFFQPSIANRSGPLFEHCAIALDHSLATGVHGLPLIGTGDWNDGMNRVGRLGRGESVWLGWFLYATLESFMPIAARRGDHARVERWRTSAAALKIALQDQGWDGAWYRRGFYDDGGVLGSAANEECRIDSIAQSWSVISAAGTAPRPAAAMAAVDEELVKRDSGLALLFTPPFDQTPADPGYIKGYPPGIRENGGQYTHAAAWSVIAFAQLGQTQRAAELFALLNPINHSASASDVARYKVEPYVIAADIYSVAPHIGRGGWTWYTGSAAWLYRAGLESILGLRLQGDLLSLRPAIPADWTGFGVSLRYGTARYEIQFDNRRGSRGSHEAAIGALSIDLDGKRLPIDGLPIALVDDGKVHSIRYMLTGEARATLAPT